MRACPIRQTLRHGSFGWMAPISQLQTLGLDVSLRSCDPRWEPLDKRNPQTASHRLDASGTSRRSQLACKLPIQTTEAAVLKAIRVLCFVFLATTEKVLRLYVSSLDERMPNQVMAFGTKMGLSNISP